eukprot:6461941-Amphidinium_carterae.1
MASPNTAEGVGSISGEGLRQSPSLATITVSPMPGGARSTQADALGHDVAPCLSEWHRMQMCLPFSHAFNFGSTLLRHPCKLKA